MAGHVGLELRNVVANYPFESLRGFPGSEPNSGQGDHSRLSCSAGIRSSGLGSAGIFSQRSARTLAIMRRRREGTNWPRSLSIRRWSGGGKAAQSSAASPSQMGRDRRSLCLDVQSGRFPRRLSRKAHERDKPATETRLRGWACKIRTQKRRRKLSL